MADTPLAFQRKEKHIGDTLYSVEPLGFVDGRKGFVRLSNVLGPALELLGAPGKVTDEAAAAAHFMGAIGGFLRSIKDDDLSYFETLFAAKTEIVTDAAPDKRPQLKHVITTHFAPGAGRFEDYFAWLAFCLQVTYGDFFASAWRKLAANLPQGASNQAASVFRSP